MNDLTKNILLWVVIVLVLLVEITGVFQATITSQTRQITAGFDLRVDVAVADLLPSVADQEVMRVGGPDWADR